MASCLYIWTSKLSRLCSSESLLPLHRTQKASPWHQQAGRKDAGQQLAENGVLRRWGFARKHVRFGMQIQYLVGGWATLLNNICQLGWLSPIIIWNQRKCLKPPTIIYNRLYHLCVPFISEGRGTTPCIWQDGKSQMTLDTLPWLSNQPRTYQTKVYQCCILSCGTP